MSDYYKIGESIVLNNGINGQIIEVYGQNNNDHRAIVKKHGYLVIQLIDTNPIKMKVVPANTENVFSNEITVLEFKRELK
jgi:hypothetical protein